MNQSINNYLPTISTIIEKHAFENEESLSEDIQDFTKKFDLDDKLYQVDKNYLFITSGVYIFFSTYEKNESSKDDVDSNEKEISKETKEAHKIKESISQYLIGKIKLNKEYYYYLIELFHNLMHDKTIQKHYNLNQDELNFINQSLLDFEKYNQS